MNTLIFSNFLACSVCFGNPNSLQSKALSGAILLLLILIGGILTAIAGLAFQWSRRASALEMKKL